MPNFISEDQIEQEILRKLNREFGYEPLNCYTIDPEDNDENAGHLFARRDSCRAAVYGALVPASRFVREDASDEAIKEGGEKAERKTGKVMR